MTIMYRVLVRSTLTKGRMLGLGALAVLPVVLALGLRVGHPSDPAHAAYSELVEGYCLAILTPVVSLVLASAALGDPAEDRTLVYLWLKPVARWKIAVAAVLAALTGALPLTVVPTVAAAALAGHVNRLPLGAALASTAAVAAYSTLFLGLGLRVRRALVWGLAYLLIWEGAVAHTARGAARISVQVQARSILAAVTGHAPPRNAVATTTAIIAPVVVVIVAMALATRWLTTTDVA